MDHEICHKEEIIAEMKAENEAMKKDMDKRLHDGDLQFQKIIDKIDTLTPVLANVEQLNKRLYVDNGKKSIQTVVQENRHDIDAILDILKKQSNIVRALLIALVVGAFGAFAKHMGWV